MTIALANEDDNPRCPMCQGKTVQMEDKLFRCNSCRMLTDGIDDGDIGYKTPERYASNKEEYHQRQAARQARSRKRLTRNRRIG